MDALFIVLRTGCQMNRRPHDTRTGHSTKDIPKAATKGGTFVPPGRRSYGAGFNNFRANRRTVVRATHAWGSVGSLIQYPPLGNDLADKSVPPLQGLGNFGSVLTKMSSGNGRGRISRETAR